MSDTPKIITICGSSRFCDEMAIVAWEFEKGGFIVLGLNLLPDWYTDQSDHQAEFEGIAEQMDELHLRKIDLADSVFIYNKDGYIGESTSNEIAYARAQGKPIEFLEEQRDERYQPPTG